MLKAVFLEMPTEGQFVAVWVYDGVVWSNTYKWEDARLKIYHEVEDEWSYNQCKVVPDCATVWSYIVGGD